MMDYESITEVAESVGVQVFITEFVNRGLISVDKNTDEDELFQCLLAEHLEEVSEYASSLVTTVPTLRE